MRSSRSALTMSGRWVGGGAVALVHLLFLLALLMTDRLTQHKVPDVRPMIVYRVPEESMATRMPPSAGSASRITSLPSVTAPRLDGPMIVIRPDKPQSPGFQGLDLSVKPSKTLSLDDLAPPSQEKRLKQFFKETAEANRLANEPPGGMECKSELTSKDGAAVSMGGGYRDPVPIQTVCSPRSSAKELAKRNQRYSPP